MRFARWVFAICGLYGIVALAPLYFMETRLGQDYPPPISHPEFFYANIGVALAWQVAFLVVCVDPARFRPIMLVGVLEKLGYGVPAVILFLQGRSPALVLCTGLIDLLMAVLFLGAYQRTATPPLRSTAAPMS
ncbi:MAG TPA: hypothetical protein VMR25_22720 [Planctomycetaceae bacterium]|jgi:hypothetical protein|nr:hypothetical protein [Planctomycetaceae bacterium]